jgi:hypothetical protein
MGTNVTISIIVFDPLILCLTENLNASQYLKRFYYNMHKLKFSIKFFYCLKLILLRCYIVLGMICKHGVANAA